MKRKLFAWILTLTVLMSVLSGCGAQTTQNIQNPQTQAPTTKPTTASSSENRADEAENTTENSSASDGTASDVYRTTGTSSEGSMAARGSQNGGQESASTAGSSSNAKSNQSSNNNATKTNPEMNSNATKTNPKIKGDSSEPQNTETEAATSSSETSAGSSILVVYFSHTGENYSVGVIKKGNTHIIADMIAEETGADMFEIQPVNPYPDTYDGCKDVAKQEQNKNARPEIIGGVANMEQYDTIFIGYPIWWGDLPMVVYTFLESYDFSGKTIIPFCTHEGSGLSGTNRSIGNVCSGATVLGGLAIRGSVAQNQQDTAKSDVVKWLNGLNY